MIRFLALAGALMLSLFVNVTIASAEESVYTDGYDGYLVEDALCRDRADEAADSYFTIPSDTPALIYETESNWTRVGVNPVYNGEYWSFDSCFVESEKVYIEPTVPEVPTPPNAPTQEPTLEPTVAPTVAAETPAVEPTAEPTQAPVEVDETLVMPAQEATTPAGSEQEVQEAEPTASIEATSAPSTEDHTQVTKLPITGSGDRSAQPSSWRDSIFGMAVVVAVLFGPPLTLVGIVAIIAHHVDESNYAKLEHSAPSSTRLRR